MKHDAVVDGCAKEPDDVAVHEDDVLEVRMFTLREMAVLQDTCHH
jgi:hypothetical protein